MTRCPCGKEAAWSLAVADTQTADFRIRPDLCPDCYRNLPPEEQSGWVSSLTGAIDTFVPAVGLLQTAQTPECGFRHYIVAVAGQALFVAIAVSESGEGELTGDILEFLIRAVEYRTAAKKEPLGETPLPTQVHVAPVSAPFISAQISDEVARELLSPEGFADLMAQLRRQRQSQ